jgi:hypothetical protein
MQASPLSDMVSVLLDAPSAAARLHINVRTLANWRWRGCGPRYIRSGSRALYRQADLDAWIESHSFAHTADERMRAGR